MISSFDWLYVAVLCLVVIGCIVIVLHPRIDDNLLQRTSASVIALSCVAEIAATLDRIQTDKPMMTLVVSVLVLMLVTVYRRIRR